MAVEVVKLALVAVSLTTQGQGGAIVGDVRVQDVRSVQVHAGPCQIHAGTVGAAPFV